MRRTRGQVFAAGAPAPLVEHWDGRAWHRVALPSRPRHLGRARHPADQRVDRPRRPGPLERPPWRTVGLPARLATPRLGSVLARSATSVWVGGAIRNRAGGSTEAVGHWNGRGWTVVTLPAPAGRAHYHVTQLVTDGAGGIWAIGQCASCDRIPSRLWHERAGRWSGPFVPRLARPRWILFGLAAAGHSVWADGAVDGARISGLIARWAPARSFG